jgi:regulatory protein
MSASARGPSSLRARALACLARREHSRSELARKLARHAQSRDEVDRTLDELEAENLLSAPRFAQSVARRRGERYGVARVRQELKSHGIDGDLLRASTAQLASTELQRARAILARRFGRVATDAAQRQRQMRFLAGRGFSGEVVRRIVGADDD